MNKEQIIKMLNEAKEDEYGNLYVLGKYNNRIYFGTITTICDDLMNMVSYPEDHEVYDRHFWNDDTLECKIVNTQKNNTPEYAIPKRIEKLKNEQDLKEVATKVNEIVEVLNKYESIVEGEK